MLKYIQARYNEWKIQQCLAFLQIIASLPSSPGLTKPFKFATRIYKK